MTALPKSIESHLIWRHTVQLLVQAPMASLLERTMEILMKRFPFVASLSLIIPEVECFVVFGGSRSSSGGCCSGRRLHDANGHITAPNAHGGKLTSLLHVGANERRTLVYGSGLIAPSRVRKVGMQLLATMEDQRGGYRMTGGDDQYVEEDEGPMAASGDQKRKVVYLEEFEAYLRDTMGEDVYPLKGLHKDDRKANDGESDGLEDKNQGVTGGSVDKGEDGLGAKSEYLISISGQDFFDDLVPVEEYQPTDFPDDAMYSREKLLNANLSCAENPFDDSSFYVDRDIKVGNIDEKKKEAIQPMMRVVEQVCELIDTTDNVFSFKYTGLIVNKRGIEAWTKKLVKDFYPEAKDVKLVTNRTRDKRDY